MKVLSLIGLLSLVIIMPCIAQQPNVTEGQGTPYDSLESGFYAAHATYPFGTHLIVTNLRNQKQVTVQVGGRIPEDNVWKIAISSDAATVLGMAPGFTPLRFTEAVKEAKAKSRRIFTQAGQAIVENTMRGVEFTVAHPSLPLQSKIKITNQRNQRQAEATVVGRIPITQSRILALSQSLARNLNVTTSSVPVFIEAAN
jgi:rare lipoprotein A (peptidoglycan hydrolase)